MKSESEVIYNVCIDEKKASVLEEMVNLCYNRRREADVRLADQLF